MAAPKGNQNAKGNKGGGRPTKYKPEYERMAFTAGLLGATDADLADLFDVAEDTINVWKKRYVKFSRALKRGKAQADAQVATSLYRRATGYEHNSQKIVADAKTKTSHVVPFVERFPPDTVACIFWLKNRQPKLWRDRAVNDPPAEAEESARKVRQLLREMADADGVE